MLQLTSYERVRRFLGDSSEAITSTTQLKFQIHNWITSVSSQIEQYLDRDIKKTSYTEYFDTTNGKIKYFVKSPPISSITSLKESADGIFDGTETTWSSNTYFIGNESKCFVIETPIEPRVHTLQIVYTGGLAEHATRSTYTITTGTNFTSGKYVIGDDSDALGIVRATTATSLTIEIIRGIFSTEGITEYEDEDGTTATGTTDTISAVSSQALVESYPDIVAACEMQIRYNWKHKDDFELVGTSRDATNLRRDERNAGLGLTKEVVNMLKGHRRIILY